VSRPGTFRSAAASTTFLLVPIAAVVSGYTAAIDLQSGNSLPVVRITQPAESRVLSWASPFRYAIRVSDREDGESASGEIPPHRIVLEVEYRQPGEAEGQSRRTNAPAGLDVIRTSACLTCHADKTALVGPSFSAMAQKYDNGPETLRRLAGHIKSGSSGTWGSLAMPPHSDLSDDQAVAAARFIVEQGSQRHRWLYAGAEGVVRIINKPADVDTGTYVLTASYLDNGIGGVPATRTRAEHSVTFVIK